MRKNATSTCAVLLALLAAAGAARAQDSVSPERHTGSRDVPFIEGDATSLGFAFRYTDLNGDLGFLGGATRSWDDLFNSGLGASVDLVFLNELDKGFHLGPYFKVSGDVFMADEDVPVDDLMLLRGMAGIAARFTFGPVYFEFRGGVGGLLYTATEVELTPGVSTEIFEGSAHFGWEGHASFGAKIGESSSLSFGFGYEANDAPNGSEDVPTFEPKQLKGLVVTLGINFGL